jgi:hypothetical protein
MEEKENWKAISFHLEFKNKVTCFRLVVRATARPLQIPEPRVRFIESPYQPLPLECQLQCSIISLAFSISQIEPAMCHTTEISLETSIAAPKTYRTPGCYQIPFQPYASGSFLSLF